MKQIGFVGLGKMGKGMVKRLPDGGYEVVAYDLLADAVEEVRREGATGASSLEELITYLRPHRTI